MYRPPVSPPDSAPSAKPTRNILPWIAGTVGVAAVVGFFLPDAQSPSATTAATTATMTAAPTTTRTTATTPPPTEKPLAAPAVALSAETSDAATGALATLGTLPVKGRAPKTGYDRALFGQAWSDDVTVDGGHNGCDTRNDILRRDLTAVALKPGSNGCTVLTGTLADAYTGATVDFTRGQDTSRAVEVDHVVALSDSWQKGAQQLDEPTRRNFANDPRNLQAVDGPTNQSKGDGDAATWLPPNKAYRCTYVARQVEVKAAYGLWVTEAERDAITRVLGDCGAAPARVVPAAAADDEQSDDEHRAPIAPAPVPRQAPEPVRQQTPAPAAPAPAPRQAATAPVAPVAPPAPVPLVAPPAPEPAPRPSASYANCSAVRAAGAAPLYSGDPGYSRKLDRDGDGVACE